MSLKKWNRIAMAGTLCVVAGLSLTVMRVSVGEFVLALGIAVSLVAVGGMFRHHALKRPVCCPQCGAALAASGRGIHTHQFVTCDECGTWVDLLEHRGLRKQQ